MFSEILEIIQSLYSRYVLGKIKNRKNVHFYLQPDTIIIACIIWGMMNGLTTQRSIYRSVRSILVLENFTERSRFTRLCVNLVIAIKIIWYHFVIEHANPRDHLFAIIDSFPSPLCKSVRNIRAKVLSEVADIGYNSTKKLHFYGLKISLMVTKTGFPLIYTVTKASIHDVNMAEKLSFGCPIEKLLGDKGYISSNMQKRLLNKGIELYTPLKKNAKNSDKIDDSLLAEHRKVIETVFSSWENLGIQNFKSRSLLGFESRLESILLVYCLMLSKTQERYGDTLKYFLGRF
ncbi:TPA: IS982 family transposase [Enterococcus faecalis]